MAADFFQRVDEGQRNCRLRLGQVVLDGLVDIALRPLTKDDRPSWSPLAGFADPIAKRAEVVRIGGDRRGRRCALE